ncbi:Threonine-tRNA ligase, cytoplasmic [Smittium culicis]|uniref:threonine--tRNA ligase n=1 Tax=Smittium culicis TaxID=133412 RepID=A0A1R1XGM0_9FUNG|nr:Threonine-tRNA ligase, cytoplasmic [Smittium culicis]
MILNIISINKSNLQKSLYGQHKRYSSTNLWDIEYSKQSEKFTKELKLVYRGIQLPPIETKSTTPLDILRANSKNLLKTSKVEINPPSNSIKEYWFEDDINENDIFPVISGSFWELNKPIDVNGEIRFLNFKNLSDRDEILKALWRSSAFLLSAGVYNTLSEKVLIYNNKVLDHSLSENNVLHGGGFYSEFYSFIPEKQGVIYDILNSDEYKSTNEEQILKKIELICSLPQNTHRFLNKGQSLAVWKEYEKLCSKNDEISFLPVNYDLAMKLTKDNPFVQYLISQKAKRNIDTFKFYRLGNYIGYSDGSIFTRPSILKNKLDLKLSSSHFLIDSDDSSPLANPEKFSSLEPTLNRIYGISLLSKEAIQEFSSHQSEMAKNDHRIIGKDQSLFMMHTLAPGSPFFLTYGTRIVNRILALMRNKYSEYGFEEVITPQIYLKSLWETSGHWENYKKDMFGVVDAYTESKGDSLLEGGGCCSGGHGNEDGISGLKPMNCPGHCLIFASKVRSYRDLPLRLADLSPLHRNEPVGSLSGLTRVRRFHQDDGHIFCSYKDIQEEIYKQLQMLDDVYSIFKFRDYSLCLSTRPLDHYIGDEAQWNEAESMLKSALDKTGKKWTENKGDGAFYGPKIDIHVKDVFGRNHQTATIQLDFQLPKRFKLKFTDKNGSIEEPVIIHRAVLGSVERMLAILSEHYKGKWPFWASPRQALVVPILPKASKDGAEDTTDSDIDIVINYAKEVHNSLRGGNFAKSSRREDSQISSLKVPNYLSSPQQDKLISELLRARMENYKFFVDLDSSLGSMKLGRVVKDARLSRYNYLIAVGIEEAKKGLVNVRAFNGLEIGTVYLIELQQKFMEMMDNFD